MIRMAYLDDGKLRNRLKKAYLKKMNTKYLQGKWKKTISAIPELAAFNYSLEKLLVAPFGELVKIAKEFKKIYACTYVYDDKGKVDMEASRRVEFLFRLKDEEMVREMIEILSEEEAGADGDH